MLALLLRRTGIQPGFPNSLGARHDGGLLHNLIGPTDREGFQHTLDRLDEGTESISNEVL